MVDDDNRAMRDDLLSDLPGAAGPGPTASEPDGGWPSGALRLPDWGLIRASGGDAQSFLQGQLTNDLSKLPAGQARLAGHCSAKGRLLASFVVWPAGPDTWLLACSADLLPQALKRLSMFVLRAKCTLSEVSAELSLWGLSGAQALAWLGDAAPAAPWALATIPATAAAGGPVAGAQAVRLPDALGQPRFLYLAPTAAAAPALPELAPEVWRWLEVASGVVRICAPTAEAFVPQMVNFELVGGVDFQKGCYPGQEVVARSQYRGTLKRRGALLACTAPMAAGQEVFHDADPGQPAGLVALAASLGADRHLALVELKRAALLGGSLRLGAADGPLLQPQALPYALPQDEP